MATESPKSAAFTSFLSRIGHQNTNFLRHICIDSNFPTVNNVVLQGDNLELLELIREKCTGIAILEISPRDFQFGISEATVSQTINQAVLEVLDARFKAISSLKEVIVRDRDFDGLSDDLMKKMRDYGWTIKLENGRIWRDRRMARMICTVMSRSL